MARSSSGRLVIEVDPELKAELYAALERNQLTLKEWFVTQADQFLYENVQLALKFNSKKPKSAEAKNKDDA